MKCATRVVEVDNEHGPIVTTVFYDAIGRAKIEVEEDLEAVILTSRDGRQIARLTQPEGCTLGKSRDLVEKIASLASKAQKSA